MPNAAEKPQEKGWCTPCGAWRVPLRSSPAAPPQCPVCRSGRIRPPLKGEHIPKRADEPPPV